MSFNDMVTKCRANNRNSQPMAKDCISTLKSVRKSEDFDYVSKLGLEEDTMKSTVFNCTPTWVESDCCTMTRVKKEKGVVLTYIISVFQGGNRYYRMDRELTIDLEYNGGTELDYHISAKDLDSGFVFYDKTADSWEDATHLVCNACKIIYSDVDFSASTRKSVRKSKPIRKYNTDWSTEVIHRHHDSMNRFVDELNSRISQEFGWTGRVIDEFDSWEQERTLFTGSSVIINYPKTDLQIRIDADSDMYEDECKYIITDGVFWDRHDFYNLDDVINYIRENVA